MMPIFFASKSISKLPVNIKIPVTIYDKLCVFSWQLYHIGESFQDYSYIKDFEADFPQKVSLKILN